MRVHSFLLVVALWSFLVPSYCADLYISNAAISGNGTLAFPYNSTREALANVAIGDVLHYAPGYYEGTDHCDLRVYTLFLSFIGDSKENTFWHCDGTRIFLLANVLGVEIKNITFIGSPYGTANRFGAGISISTSVVVFERCTFKEFVGMVGSAILAQQSNITILETEFLHNEAEVDAGGFYGSITALYVYDSVFVNNTARIERGGALSCQYCSGTIARTEFVQNSAYKDGGAISFRGTVMDLENNQALHNRAVDGGGFLYSAASRINVIDLYAEGNTADEGGVLYFEALSEEANTFEKLGWTVSNSTFVSNHVADEGGVSYVSNFNNGLWEGCRFFNNSAGAEGGAMRVKRSHVNIVGCYFEGNIAEGLGGAIEIDKTTSDILHSSFLENTANSGGGAFLNGDCEILMAFNYFAKNHAIESGGGIFHSEETTFEINNCTVDENTALYGGGMYSAEANSISMSGLKARRNVAQVAGGALFFGGIHEEGFRFSTAWCHTADSAGNIAQFGPCAASDPEHVEIRSVDDVNYPDHVLLSPGIAVDITIQIHDYFHQLAQPGGVDEDKIVSVSLVDQVTGEAAVSSQGSISQMTSPRVNDGAANTTIAVVFNLTAPLALRFEYGSDLRKAELPIVPDDCPDSYGLVETKVSGVYQCAPQPVCTAEDYSYTMYECEGKHQNRLVTFHWTTPKSCAGGELPQDTHIECDFIMFDSPIAITMVVISSLGIAVTLFCVWIAIAFRKHPSIRAAQPPFMIILCAGCIFMLMSNILNVGVPDDGICIMRFFSTMLAFHLIIVALMCKSLRVYWLFKGRRRLHAEIPDSKMLLYFAALTTFFSLFVVIWVVVDAPAVVTYTDSEPLIGEYTRKECSSQYANGGVAVVACFLLIEISLLLVMAFRIRKVNDQYHDSKAVFVSTYNTAFFLALMTPVIFGLEARPEVEYLLQSIGQLYICLFMLGAMFFSKVRHALFLDPEAAQTKTRNKLGSGLGTMMMTRFVPNKNQTSSSDSIDKRYHSADSAVARHKKTHATVKAHSDSQIRRYASNAQATGTPGETSTTTTPARVGNDAFL
eukprot:Rmarinus@m.24932